MVKIACLLKGYPRLSETFIAQEILALEQAGIDIIIYSLRHPTDTSIHPVHEKINATVHYLPEYLHRHPIRVSMALLKALFNKAFYRLLPVFFRDLWRDFTPNRIRRFGQALVLARELDAEREWIYVHFLHTPASVARYTSHLTDLPWSCSAHAKDIWTSKPWDIREKLAELQWLVTCTRANTRHLKALSPDKNKVSLLYHGLDLSRFPQPRDARRIDGLSADHPVQIISVGRAVTKKGFDVLLDALARLPANLHWRFTHIGGGQLLQQLTLAATQLGINDNITWLGAQNFAQVISCYQAADIFVLASRIDKNGDRDGLPNVLMEAMTQKLPCIASNISGIPELIEHRHNGLLVEPEQPDELAACLGELITSPARRAQLGENGYLRVTQDFALESNIKQLVARFRSCA